MLLVSARSLSHSRVQDQSDDESVQSDDLAIGNEKMASISPLDKQGVAGLDLRENEDQNHRYENF